MEILGVPVPHIRKAVRRLRSEVKHEPDDVWIALAHRLIEANYHESRQVAYELLALRSALVHALTRKEIEALGKGMDNWASVDTFSVSISGVAWREGRISDSAVHAWTRSRNLWWRRCALVSTVALNLVSRGGHGDPDRTFEVCEALAEDREPMVAKALSWALRSVLQHAPERVREFLDRHGESLPTLVRREVTRKLDTGRKGG